MKWLDDADEMQSPTVTFALKFLLGLVLGIIVTTLSRLLFVPSSVVLIHRSPNRVQDGVFRPKCGSEPRLSENVKYVVKEGKRELILIGVMTANMFLETRARAVYDTWGKEIPGKLLFFTPETTNLSSTLPIVALPAVDDTYPPQKKSFLTLKYMYENYGDKFEWFMRADDDVYIRPDRLEKFLRNLNSSKKHFIGQAGIGNKQEFGLLSLEYDENFCMGGPGMIMSHKTLAAVAPNVKQCLQNLYSTHEDTEIGRCVQRFAGVPCTWSYEMQNVFYHNSAGVDAFTGTLKNKEVHRAITLHPLKKHSYMYRLHNYMRSLQINNLDFDEIVLRRQLERAKTVLLSLANGTLAPDLEGAAQGFIRNSVAVKTFPTCEKEIIPWDFISRSLFSLSQTNPRRKIDGALQEALDDIVREVMDRLNTHSRERGRIIDFKEVYYASTQVNPLHGAAYLVDLLLIYKKYRGRKMTVQVRHHGLFQRNFKTLDMREITGYKLSGSSKKWRSPTRRKLSSEDGRRKRRRVTDDIEKSLDYIEDLEAEYGDVAEQEDEIFDFVDGSVKEVGLSYDLMKQQAYREMWEAPGKVIHMIVPLAGRVSTFRRFLKTYKSVVLARNEPVKLFLVLYDDPKYSGAKVEILELLRKHEWEFANFLVTVVEASGDFSRGNALELGVDRCADDALMFFNDIDVLFDEDALFRIRLQTVMNQQINYPVVFSEYDPSVGRNEGERPNHFDISEEAGYWRSFGYGIMSIYKSDLKAIGGFDKSIVGWGKEDVDLFQKAVRSNLSIFRSADPGLVHVFHHIECDMNLEVSQKVMCDGSRVNTVFSQKFLAKHVAANESLEKFPFFDKMY